MALAKGQLLRALWYHPAVPVTVAWGSLYMISQTIWRLRGKSGRALHYHARWLIVLLCLIIINCVLKNFLLLGFGIVM